MNDPTPQELAAWPNCATPDCEHKACASHNCSERMNAFNSAPAHYFDEFRNAQAGAR